MEELYYTELANKGKTKTKLLGICGITQSWN